MKSCLRVLIPVNGSLDVLERGLEMIADDNCWITVLKVLPEYQGDIDLTGVRDIDAVLSSDHKRIKKILEEAIRNEAGARVRVEHGDIGETISRVAEEEICDLVIMSSANGGGFIRRFLDGNLLKNVVAKTSCPVMVVE